LTLHNGDKSRSGIQRGKNSITRKGIVADH
jgi:hypothetical protein